MPLDFQNLTMIDILQNRPSVTWAQFQSRRGSEIEVLGSHSELSFNTLLSVNKWKTVTSISIGGCGSGEARVIHQASVLQYTRQLQ